MANQSLKKTAVYYSEFTPDPEGYTVGEVDCMNKRTLNSDEVYRRLMLARARRTVDRLFTVPDEELGQDFLDSAEGKRLQESQKGEPGVG